MNNKKEGLSMEEAYMQDHPDLNEAQVHATNIGEVPEDRGSLKNPLRKYTEEKINSGIEKLMKRLKSSETLKDKNEWVKKQKVLGVTGESAESAIVNLPNKIRETKETVLNKCNSIKSSYEKGWLHLGGAAAVFGIKTAGKLGGGLFTGIKEFWDAQNEEANKADKKNPGMMRSHMQSAIMAREEAERLSGEAENGPEKSNRMKVASTALEFWGR